MKNDISQVDIRGRGFSLMEVLLAVFILGIGLIMVATIFPVGADWTRQSTEASVAQTVAQNAVTVIQNYYSPSNPNAATFQVPLAAITAPSTVGATSTLVALPGLVNIPIAERCYQFGNTNPFPATNPANCTYFWTALVRVQPGSQLGPSRRYDLYILVFRKGDNTQLFTTFPAGATEVAGVRDVGGVGGIPTVPTMNSQLEPTLVSATWGAASPPVGYIGIGLQSGTVFTQSIFTDFTQVPAVQTTTPRPALLGQTTPTTPPSEPVIYAPPSTGTTNSPLVYVFQTTVSF